jgi:thioredoxin 1
MNLKVVDSQNFEAEVLNNPKPILVEFGATWCPPCKALLPVLEQLQAEHPEYDFVKLDIDDSPELSQAYKVKGVPTLISFKDGKQHKIHVGMASSGQLLQLLQ